MQTQRADCSNLICSVSRPARTVRKRSRTSLSRKPAQRRRQTLGTRRNHCSQRKLAAGALGCPEEASWGRPRKPPGRHRGWGRRANQPPGPHPTDGAVGARAGGVPGHTPRPGTAPHGQVQTAARGPSAIASSPWDKAAVLHTGSCVQLLLGPLSRGGRGSVTALRTGDRATCLSHHRPSRACCQDLHSSRPPTSHGLEKAPKPPRSWVERE